MPNMDNTYFYNTLSANLPTQATLRQNWINDHPNHLMTHYANFTLRVAPASEADIEVTSAFGPVPTYSIMCVKSEGMDSENVRLSQPYGWGDLAEAIEYAEIYMGSRTDTPVERVLSPVHSFEESYPGELRWHLIGESFDSIIPGLNYRLPVGVPRRYCGECTAYLPATQLRTCDICMSQICTSHAHEHNGDYCDDCGFEVLNSGETFFCDDCEYNFCTHHRDSHYHNEYDEPDDYHSNRRPFINRYGSEASLEFLDESYKNHDILRMERAAAVELEVEYLGDGTEGSPKLSDYVGVGGDGSLSNGIEVTLPPSKGAMLAKFMHETCSALREAGYGIEESCGMHTHIDMRDKVEDKRFLAHLFNALFTFEDVLYAMQQNDRKNSEYTIPLRSTYKFYEMYGQEVDSFDFNFYKQVKTPVGKRVMDSEKEHKYATPRYASFNFHSMYFRGSLECRIHEGLLDADEALRWIDLLQRIVARVERGHSYEFMRKFVGVNVTQAKVSAFCRYFKIPKDMRLWITKRIASGQGIGYNLGAFKWGSPKRGQAKKIVSPARDVPFLQQDVACQRCGFQFRMRRSLERCPDCRRRLITDWGEALYAPVVVPSPSIANIDWSSAFVNDIQLNDFIYDEPVDDDTF